METPAFAALSLRFAFCQHRVSETNSQMTPTSAPTQEEHSRDASAPLSAQEKSPFSSREQTLLVVLLLVASTLLLYRPVLHHQFVMYDDGLYVYQNAHVLQGLSWENVRWASTATFADNWHPLTWLSHMTDVELFGLKPMGHHLDSLLWHVLNVILLFLLLRAATGYLWRSATVAALFALCPLNVECVAWVAERKSLLCTTFLLLTLFAYGWYARRPNVPRYLAVAALFALGLMAKPMIVTLPALLLLADYWPLQRFTLSAGTGSLRRFGRLVTEKIPLLSLSAASSFITIYAQRAGGALTSTSVIPLGSRIENAVYSYALYVVKMFWPSRLAAFHPYPTLRPWTVAAAALALIAITALVWRYRTNKPLVAGWAWYLVTLLPVIGIVQVFEQGWAERYAYIPFIGLFVAIVWTAADLAQRGSWKRWLAPAGAVAALLCYAAISCVQIGYWQDTNTLFSHALAVTSRNAIAETNIGVLDYNAGHLNLAERHFRAAVEYMPDLGEARYDLGLVLLREGRSEEAVENAVAGCNVQLRINPNDAGCLLGRAKYEYRKEQFDKALADANRAASLAPPSAAAYSMMGQIYEREGNIQAAAESYRKALAINPNSAEASLGLAALQRNPQR
jgi:protein O-mannosyl-transferase